MAKHLKTVEPMDGFRRNHGKRRRRGEEYDTTQLASILEDLAETLNELSGTPDCTFLRYFRLLGKRRYMQPVSLRRRTVGARS